MDNRLLNTIFVQSRLGLQAVSEKSKSIALNLDQCFCNWFFVSIPYLDARQTISIDGNQLVIGGKQSTIKNVRIWEHGAETNIFNYHHVTSHYAVQVFSGSVRDILRQLHFVSNCKAYPGKENEFDCLECCDGSPKM